MSLQLSPELIAVLGTVVGGLVAAIVKLYTDLRTSENQRRDEAKANVDTLLKVQATVFEAVNKLTTFTEALTRRRL